MQPLFVFAQWLVRIGGVLLLLLGLLFWTGDARQLVGAHTLLGIVVVLALWVLAALAVPRGVPVGMAVGAAVVGLLVLVLGLTQRSVLPESNHWIVQVLHLLVGLAAVGIGEAIGGRVRRARLASAA